MVAFLLVMLLLASQARVLFSAGSASCAGNAIVCCDCCDCGDLCPCTVRDQQEVPPGPPGLPADPGLKLNFIPASSRAWLEPATPGFRETKGPCHVIGMAIDFYDGIRLSVAYCSLVI